MIMKIFIPILFIPVILIGGCSGGEDKATLGQPGTAHVLEGQMRALEEAKEVEGVIQRGDDARRQAIEEQSR